MQRAKHRNDGRIKKKRENMVFFVNSGKEIKLMNVNYCDLIEANKRFSMEKRNSNFKIILNLIILDISIEPLSLKIKAQHQQKITDEKHTF